MRLPRRRGVRGGMESGFEISRCSLLYTRWINTVLVHSTGDYVQYPAISHDGKESEKECICVYICVHACESLQSGSTLFNPMDCSLPGSSVHEERILEWWSFPSPYSFSESLCCIPETYTTLEMNNASIKKKTKRNENTIFLWLPGGEWMTQGQW